MTEKEKEIKVDKEIGSRVEVQSVVKWAQYFAVIPAYIVIFHAFQSLPAMESNSLKIFINTYIERASLIDQLSFAYLAIILIVSSIYSVALIIPVVGSFFGLDDPVIAISFAIFISCIIYDLINSLDFSATKFGVGLFTGTLVKEKFKSLKKLEEKQ
jgi:hypothetical protein